MPNQILNKEGPEASQLFRRFFIFDTISGITGSTYSEDEATIPNYVRYAKDVRLIVELDALKWEGILRPYLQITYNEKSTKLIKKETTVDMTYLMDYFEESQRFWNACIIVISIVQALTLIVVIVRIYAFN